jgi:methionyl aminopeptidase
LSDKIPPVHSPEDIEKIRLACKIARGALDEGHRLVRAGVKTEEIDEAIHNYIISHEAYPSPLNYYNFPRSCCTSVNECICHGIPDTRPL